MRILILYKGLAQQFQRYKKLPHTKWIFPTAPFDEEVGMTAWYRPHDLPSAFKPRVPQGHEEEEESSPTEIDEEEDADGILRSVAYLDSLIEEEVEKRGTDPLKIIVGGFSQGCAVSMTWGLVGKWKNRIGGVCGLSGYLPLIRPVQEALTKPTGEATTDVDQIAGEQSKSESSGTMKWFFAHGMADRAVAVSLFAQGQERLRQGIDSSLIEGHVYPDLAHTIAGAEIRDIWLWMSMILGESSS